MGNNKTALLSQVTIRPILPTETHLLEDLLYESIYQPQGAEPIPREVLQVPKVAAYIKYYGTAPDDYCFVAEHDGNIIGAVWVRVLSGKHKGYGNIDNETPEFVISLYPEYRNQGLGSRLMKTMLNYLKVKGYKQSSLSVQKENYATQLYLKLGFKVIEENNEDFIMLKTFN
jgi:ribosomal protein S18 acetylase RimI-like enzyme